MLNGLVKLLAIPFANQLANIYTMALLPWCFPATGTLLMSTNEAELSESKIRSFGKSFRTDLHTSRKIPRFAKAERCVQWIQETLRKQVCMHMLTCVDGTREVQHFQIVIPITSQTLVNFIGIKTVVLTVKEVQLGNRSLAFFYSIKQVLIALRAIITTTSQIAANFSAT